MATHPPIAISGLGALSALGTDVAAHHHAILQHHIPFQKLSELLGKQSPHAHRYAAWIQSRTLLTHRKWSPATMAALHVAAQAIHATGWQPQDLRHAALVVGTSRGNAAGWLGPWPGRRPFKVMAASNTIHSEPASAISIEFGITGPNHVLASGCSAGLDALGIAMLMLHAGLAPRALVVAVDLPLVPLLLDNYASSKLLSKAHTLDPYHPATSGFIPGEGAAAIAIESHLKPNSLQLSHYACNSDAMDPVGIPSHGGLTTELLEQALQTLGPPSAISPHATGTQVQAIADPAVLSHHFTANKPPLHLLKPFIGHTIGASGLLETVILADFLKHKKLPPNLPHLTAPPGFQLPDQSLDTSGHIYKLSHGMGGHNALLVLSTP